MIRLALLAIALCLAGCDMIKAGFTPATEKINTAFPLSDEVQLDRNRLLASLEANRSERQRVTGQLDKLMEVRALSCTALTPVGRFDSPANIRAKVTDANCFNTQDAALEEWVGMQRVALALNAPPLVALAPLPSRSLLPNTTDTITAAAVAADANVMVVRSQQQQFMALQLPAGKQISSFSIPESDYRLPSVSPNGRLVAVTTNRGMRIFDLQTGQRLWSTHKYSEVLAWLPQVHAIVLAQAGGGLAPFVMDALQATIAPYPAAEKRLTWSAPLAGPQLLVGNRNTISVMQHARGSAGALEVSALKQWSVPNPGITSGLPQLMQEGKKLFWLSARDLGWLDLESGQQGTWSLASLNVNAIAKVSETQLVLNQLVQGMGIETRLLDVDARSLATVKDLDGRDGQLFALSPRAGFLKRSSNALVLAGSVEGDNPQELDRVVADANLAQQLAKLNPMGPTDVESGLPFVRSQPMLGVPANARVAVIGVYEPDPRGGSVRVNLAQDGAPLVLVLSSYEPVHWVINARSRKIAAVLLSGYNPSTISGHGKAEVLRVGNRYAYKPDGPEYMNLRADVARYISNPIQSFQGVYKGKEFDVH